MTEIAPLPAERLPRGVRARHVAGVNGLAMHVLEAGFETPGRPLALLLHGFPEIAYSWRRVMPALAAAGYHVVAPDQRGYGRTTGWTPGFVSDLTEFRMLNLARDALELVWRLGHARAAAVIGHDFGAPVAAWCALTRPDVFSRVAIMSAPFAGPPMPGAAPAEDVHAAMLRLDPPRKHYQWYYSTEPADADMRHAPQGLHAFLRAYFHMKSADWSANRPYRLAGWTAAELARLPTYYVMRADQDMAATVAPEMPAPDQIAACRWLPDAELAIYTEEYARVGFQGGLNWYRCQTFGHDSREHGLFAGRTIDVPSMFIAGRADWGTYQFPGALESMRDRVCTRMRGCHLLDGAGHWVQQEQPEAVIGLLLELLAAQIA